MAAVEFDSDESDFECIFSGDETGMSLVDLYNNILSKHAGLIKASPRRLRLQIDNLLLHFRLWGTEINVDSGSLEILEEKYPEQASAVNVLLRHVLHSLDKVEEEVSAGRTAELTSSQYDSINP